MYFGFNDPTLILLIPAIVFTVFAQSKVKRAYRKYANIPNRKGFTGIQAARTILDSNGMQDVPIEIIPGELTDNYDPARDVMHLRSAATSPLAQKFESFNSSSPIRFYFFLQL